MPNKHNDDRRHYIPKMRFQMPNWAAYEAGLRRRGSMTLWVSDAAIAAWRAVPQMTPGGQADILDLRQPRAELQAGAPIQRWAFDRAWGGGMYVGRMYCIAGKGKSGKTTLAGGISYAMNHSGVRHAYLALEMGAIRSSSDRSRRTSERIRWRFSAMSSRRYWAEPGYMQRVSASLV